MMQIFRPRLQHVPHLAELVQQAFNAVLHTGHFRLESGMLRRSVFQSQQAKHSRRKEDPTNALHHGSLLCRQTTSLIFDGSCKSRRFQRQPLVQREPNKEGQHESR